MSPEIILLVLAAVAILVAYFYFGGKLLGKYWKLLLFPVLCVFLMGVFFAVVGFQDPSCSEGSGGDFCGLGEAIFMIGGIFLIVGSVVTAIVGSVIAKISSRAKAQASLQKNNLPTPASK